MKQYLIIRYVDRNNWREVTVVSEWFDKIEAKVQCDWLNECLKKDGIYGKGIRYAVYQAVEA